MLNKGIINKSTVIFVLDNVFCARLGERPEEDHRAAAQIGPASENCPGSQDSPGTEPARSTAARDRRRVRSDLRVARGDRRALR